eukprot:216608-Amphidinium_carterae.2
MVRAIFYVGGLLVGVGNAGKLVIVPISAEPDAECNLFNLHLELLILTFLRYMCNLAVSPAAAV